jgi:hypothetical protein
MFEVGQTVYFRAGGFRNFAARSGIVKNISPNGVIKLECVSSITKQPYNISFMPSGFERGARVHEAAILISEADYNELNERNRAKAQRRRIAEGLDTLAARVRTDYSKQDLLDALEKLKAEAEQL